LRGWLRGRGSDAGEHGNAFIGTLRALRGHLNAAKQHLMALLGDVNAINERLEAIEHLLGRESDAHEQA
jgi:hypothetical protein